MVISLEVEKGDCICECIYGMIQIIRVKLGTTYDNLDYPRMSTPNVMNRLGDACWWCRGNSHHFTFS